MSSKQPVVVSPSGKHTATLIFLHGLGDTGHGWASSLADVRPSYVKIVCPTAQTMPVTLNSGILLCIIRERMYKKSHLPGIFPVWGNNKYKQLHTMRAFRLSNAGVV